MTKSPDDEYMEQLEAENAALKAELKAINAALDDPRTDLTMTSCEVISALKEQVAQLQAIISEEAKDSGNVILELTTLQSKSAALVDALEGLLSLDEENHQRYPGDEDVCLEVRNARAALATFKGEK